MDIDIDIPDIKITKVFKNAVRAMRFDSGEIKPHNVGVYFQNIPHLILDGEKIATIDYKTAEQLGFVKIDFLHLTFLDNFKNKNELKDYLLRIDQAPYKLLQFENICQKCFHIHNHYDVVKRVKPQNLEEVADVLALIRPAKRKYIDRYIENKEQVKPLLYKQEQGEYGFKKSHAISYAHIIAIQLLMIEENKL